MFKLSKTLGASYPAEEDDVLSMKSALTQLGEYSPKPDGPSRWTDDEMFDGMKRFQRKSGLQVDGVARPGGPTATSIGSALAETAIARTGASRSKTNPGPSAFGGETDNRAKDRRARAIAAAKRNDAAKVFGLSDAVGAGQTNPAAGVLETKKALAWAGYYPPSRANRPDPTPDEDMTWGLASFQRDFGLKQDGYMRPGGETETSLNALIAPLVQLAVQNGTVTAQNAEEPEAAEAPKKKNTPSETPPTTETCGSIKARIREAETKLTARQADLELINTDPLAVDRGLVGTYVSLLEKYGGFQRDPLPEIWDGSRTEYEETEEIGDRIFSPESMVVWSSIDGFAQALDKATHELSRIESEIQEELAELKARSLDLGCEKPEPSAPPSKPGTPPPPSSAPIS